MCPSDCPVHLPFFLSTCSSSLLSLFSPFLLPLISSAFVFLPCPQRPIKMFSFSYSAQILTSSPLLSHGLPEAVQTLGLFLCSFLPLLPFLPSRGERCPAFWPFLSGTLQVSFWLHLGWRELVGTSSGLGQEREVLWGSCSLSFFLKLWERAPSQASASQRLTAVDLPHNPGLPQSHGPPNPELSISGSPQIFPEYDLWFLLGCWVVLVHPFLDFKTFCGCERLCPPFLGPLPTFWS